MNWQIITLLIAIIFLVMVLIFMSKSKAGMVEVSSQILNQLRL